MSPDDFRLLCDKVWQHHHRAEDDAILTSQDGNERTFSLCNLGDVIFATRSVTGSDDMVEHTPCPVGTSIVGASHSHPDSDLVFSDGDYSNAINNTFLILMLSTLAGQTALSRCITFDYMAIDRMGHQQADEMIDHLWKALEYRDKVAELVITDVDQALDYVGKNLDETSEFLTIANKYKMIQDCLHDGKRSIRRSL